MSEPLFTLDAGNYRKCQQLFRGTHRREYYDGEYWVDDSAAVEVSARRRAIGPYTIIDTSAATRQFFRRTRKHIREDATDLGVLWFVRRGALVFSNQAGQRVVGEGEFLLTRSMSPFFIELQPADCGAHEILHLTVPAHLLRKHLESETGPCGFVGEQSREIAIARQMLTQVFDDDALEEDAARIIVEAAIALAGRALGASRKEGSARQSLSEQRLDEVLRFIEVHLSDPNLCTGMVSKGCGVSQRYLSLLLQGTGKTFSELVWSRRLEMAREWLAASHPRDVAIAEIAYGVGFKSTAHFSRKFKSVFGQNPRDFRDSAMTLAANDREATAPQLGAALH
ncbi:helix-turn-helix domain-containing protein [Novosphingobium sp. YJ-S2-02]|uniref:Helix-turn-helix domain-containing protein n=1 Tax=Novosphingobium aureum TaxID=2792964 RepID=A0A931HEA6_9SPHN|nr:helix-turn-helix domain-containing protein [Novosphingobium aureum]MBH0114421.1 helix-turn-helix domain-containing protein [Novosphingobium aureum]